MAKGRNVWTRRLVLVGAIVLYATLLAGNIVPNPFPGIWEWVSRDRPLAPDLVWQERLTARPGTAAVVGDTIAVNAGSHTELRDQETGTLIGRDDPPGWPAEWMLVAGADADAVLITSERMNSGYQVRDAATGRVIHAEGDAVAVWAYRDARLDLRCDDRRACTLRGFRPDGSTPDWSVDLPGRRVGTLGAHPQLASARTPDPNRIDGAVAGPARLPQYLGIPVERRDGDAVVIVETGTATVRQILKPGDGERIMVVGDRVIRSVTTRQNDICVSSVTGHDAVTGAPVWGPVPYHAWSTSACEQRTPPVAAGAAMALVGPDGQPLVVDAYDGRVLWSGDVEESVVGLSPDLAVIRPAEGDSLYGVVLGSDGTPIWHRRAEPDAEVLVARCGIIVADRDPSRVYVWEPGTGDTVVSVPTTAKVLACDDDGLVLAGGRSIGFARFADEPTPPGVGEVPGGESEAPLDSK